MKPESILIQPGVNEFHFEDPSSIKLFFGIIDSTDTEYQIDVYLERPHINLELLGVYYLEDDQKARVVNNVFHKARDCKSRVSVKGVLTGSSSRFDWSGDVFIDSLATGTDTYEENRNLLMNHGPSVSSVPNLEILTGNIVGAGHASATGQLEESQLFYLLSRGIDLDRARQMILTGFLSKQIDLIGDERISSNFKELISIPELEVDKTN